MAFDDSSLDDYNDVASRLAEFRDKHPEGRLRPADPSMPYHVVRVPNGWCIRCKGAQTVKIKQEWKRCPRCEGTGVRRSDEPQEDVFIVYAAAAYKDAGDTEPGVGMAWEPYPGRTPYTAMSELQNAETSAWGRALLAANVADTRKGVASQDEVRNRSAERDEGGWPAGTKPATPAPAENGHGGDPWQDQPPGEIDTAALEPENKPGGADSRQLKAIHTSLTNLGVTARGDGLALLTEITGSDLLGPHTAPDGDPHTSKNLSWQDAEKARKELAQRAAKAKKLAERAAQT